MVTLDITRIYPFYPAKVFLEFSIDGKKYISVPTPSLPIYIERSESSNPLDTWTLINPSGTDYLHFVDELPFLLTLTKTIYYRAYVVINGKKYYSQIETIKHELPEYLENVKRKILYDELLVMEKLTGVRIGILKRRHVGERCPKCYDPNTGKTTRSNCTTCQGTGFTNPYYTPVLTYGKRVPPVKEVDLLSRDSATEVDYTIMQIIDIPTVSPQDIVIDLKLNDRYKVEKVEITELRRVTIHQELTMSKLSRNAPEYQIQIDPSYLDLSDEISYSNLYKKCPISE